MNTYTPIAVSSITIPALPAIVSFLEKNEQYHIALISHIVRNGAPCLPPSNIKYYIVHEENGIFNSGAIRAVLAIDNGGTLLHAIDNPETADDLRNPLANLMASWDIFCIMGDKAGSVFLRSILKRRVKEVRDYQLREWQGKDMRQLTLPINTALSVCTVSDANKLMDLKKGYYFEEQALPGGTFYAPAHLKLLQDELANQRVLALQDLRNPEHPFVAKANTNAIGKNWVQLGGVYTMPAYRGKGFARYLVQQLSLYAAQYSIKTALFVKTQNLAAQNAYTAAGFITKGSFEISYFTS